MASKEMEQLKIGMKMMMEKGFAVTFDGSMDPFTLRSTIQAAQERMPSEPGVTFTSEKFGDMDAELSVPQNAREDAVIVYIHGGGLICGNAASSRGYASMLAEETQIPVYAFSYRLAPENKFPAAVDDCFEAYRAILAKNPDKPIFLIGESGGGYLSIVTAMKARDNQITMPAGVIPYSPVIDMTGRLNRVREGNRDFTVTPESMEWLAALYCSKEERTNPYVSPYLDDMHDMPPMLLAWDESETLSVDSEDIVAKLRKNGIECHAKSYPDCFHAFATTGRGTPESMEVLKDTVAFIQAHIQ